MDIIKDDKEIKEDNDNMIEEVYNESNKDTKKKSKFSIVKRIILIVMALICAIELIFFGLIKTGKWSSEQGDVFRLYMTGKFSFYNAGAGSPIGNSDLCPRYIYLGHRNIIVYGMGAVNRVSITKVTPSMMIVEFDGETYELHNSEW